ncbi:hypothetical protein Tco_1335662 [Tanacetum coccineum]
MDIKDKLNLDKNETLVDATKYRSMIGALMYLTSSIPDIVHTTCLCVRYQAKPIEKHLKEVKRIFRYLRGIINIGLQNRRDLPWDTPLDRIEVLSFQDNEHEGRDTRTQGGIRFKDKDLKISGVEIKSRPKTKISRLSLKISSQISRSKMTSMQKELQKNSQEHKALRFKTSQAVKP